MVEGQLGTEKEVIGHRLLAGLVDIVVMVLIGVVVLFLSVMLLGFFTSFTAPSSGGEDIVNVFIYLSMLLLTYGLVLVIAGGIIFVSVVLYPLFFEGWRGQTVGKMFFGIVVVKEGGSRCGWGASLLRNLFRIYDLIGFHLVGFAFMAATEKRQRMGDRLANTVVVKVK